VITHEELLTRLQIAIIASPFTGEQVAEAAGKDGAALQDILHNQDGLSSLTLALLADKLKVPVSCFLWTLGDDEYGL